MSQAIHTPPRPRASREPAGDYRLAISPSDVLERLFRLFTSMRLALVLLLALALLTLIGTLLAQAPAGIESDPQAYAAWLDSMRPRYGGWTGVLDTLGLFSVFSSIWFKGTMVLLSTSILACSVHRAPRLWRQAVHPRMIMTEAFFERAPLRAKVASPADPDAALAELRAAFRAHRFRTAVETRGDAVHVCADRFRWGPFGRIVAHVSFVVILIGAVVGATWGFRDNEFAVAVGSRAEVGNGTGMAVEARSFSDSYYANGEPRDYASELVLYEDGAAVRTQTVRVNHPLRHGGVTFYQSFFGPAAAMQVKADGKVVFDGGVPLLWSSDDGKYRIGRFSLADQGLTVLVVGAASGSVAPDIAAGQMQLEVRRAGREAPVATRVVSQGRPAKVAGLEFTFARERQFTGLIVAHDPGSTLVWLGATLLVCGVCMVFFFPHRRVRAVIRRTAGGSETRVAAIERRDTVFQSQFQQLADDIELAVTRAGVT